MKTLATCRRTVWALTLLLAAAGSSGMAQAKPDPKTTTWLCGNLVDAEGKVEAWHPMDLYAVPSGGSEDQKTHVWVSRGHFRTGGLTPGRYWLSIDRATERRWPIDLERQSSTVPCERWVQIRLTPSGPQFEWHTRDDGWVDAGTDEDNTLPRICGSLNRTFLIKTKDPSVVHDKHEGLRKVRVALYSRKPALKCCTAADLLQELLTGRGGKFEFKKVPDGAYWLVVALDGNMYALPIRLRPKKGEPDRLCSNNLFSINEDGEFSLLGVIFIVD